MSFYCRMCLIKGEQVRGEKRIFKTLKDKKIEEILCEKHHKILLNYAKKFKWKEEHE